MHPRASSESIMGKTTNSFRSLATLAVLGAVAIAPSCASAHKPEGLRRSETLAADIEDYTSSLESFKAELRETLTAYDRVVESPSGDYLTPYVRFRQGIETLTRHQEDFPDRVARIEKSARAFFVVWDGDLQRFSDGSMRERSADRLEETRKRYETLVATHAKVAATTEGLLTAMRDHALFWANDLNADSTRALERDATKLQQVSEQVVSAIDELLASASTYRRAVAMRPEGTSLLAPRN